MPSTPEPAPAPRADLPAAPDHGLGVTLNGDGADFAGHAPHAKAVGTGLVDMVHAGWVQRLLRAADWRGFPGPGDDKTGGQTRIGPKAKMIFEKLSELGISYVYLSL